MFKRRFPNIALNNINEELPLLFRDEIYELAEFDEEKIGGLFIEDQRVMIQSSVLVLREHTTWFIILMTFTTRILRKG